MRTELARAIREAGMTKAALARAVGKSRPFISNIVAGRREPDVELAWEIATALHVDLPSVFPRVSERHGQPPAEVTP